MEMKGDLKRHGKKAMLSIIASVHRWHHGEWPLVNGNDGNQSYHFLALDDISLRLHQSAYTVSYTITNTGNRRGAEVRPLFSGHPGLMLKLSSPRIQVSQLYLSHPKDALEPPSILKGFERVLLDPGESAIVRHNLTRYDLSVWNTVQQGWSRSQGTISVLIGASSRDLRLRGSIAH